MRTTRWLTATLQSDVAANDSDKTFTVPASTTWSVNTIFVKLVSTATAGNRQIEVKITDGSDVEILTIRAGAVQAASLTRFYNFGHGLADLTAFRDTDALSNPLPRQLVLPAGYKIRVRDKTAVDAAADDMDVHLLIEEMKF
ncbi:MAG: hypothetical protein L0Z53_22880 [Acidobacteriales bacterium]|nr:hypothetical protein [Terriglobales bacterium]